MIKDKNGKMMKDLQDLEKKNKLNRFDKWRFRKLLRQMKNTLEKFKEIEKGSEEEKQLKDKLVTSIISLGDIVNITYDDGKVMTEKDLRDMSNDKLIDIYERILNEVNKIV